MYRGPQEEIQNRLVIEPNNGNPRGAYNMANDRGNSPNPRYTPPTVDSSGRVTNSNLQNFALPEFNYRALMGLQQGFNPMEYLRQLFGGDSSMITPGGSRMDDVRDTAIGISRNRGMQDRMGGASMDTMPQEQPRLKPAVMPPASDTNLSKPATQEASWDPASWLSRLSQRASANTPASGGAMGAGGKPGGIAAETMPPPEGGVHESPGMAQPAFDPYSFLNRFRRLPLSNRRGGGYP